MNASESWPVMPVLSIGGTIELMDLPPLPLPAPGLNETIIVEYSDEMFLHFDLQGVKFSASGPDLNLHLPEGGTLVIENGAVRGGCVYIPTYVHTPAGAYELDAYLQEHAPNVELQFVGHSHMGEDVPSSGAGEYQDAPGALLRGVEALQAAVPGMEGATAAPFSADSWAEAPGGAFAHGAEAPSGAPTLPFAHSQESLLPEAQALHLTLLTGV